VKLEIPIAKPLLACWEAKSHPAQIRMQAYLDEIEGACRGALLPAGMSLTFFVGLGENPRWLEASDLDNFLYPVVHRLGAARFAAVRGVKSQAAESSILISDEPVGAGGLAGPAVTLRLDGSYTTEGWKVRFREKLLKAGCTPAPPGPVELHVHIGCSPSRKWANLWKPILDSCGPFLGEPAGARFSPFDGRITDLTLTWTAQPELGDSVWVGLWWG